MLFRYDPYMAQTFPVLVTGFIHAMGVDGNVDVESRVAALERQALERLGSETEGALTEIRAWRQAFSRMGLKPTQYRCASEALLRRLRQQGALPRLHPLVDLCNAVSAAHAVPVAAFDLARIEGDLTVRPAEGNESYVTFGGETEHPDRGEIIFADMADQAHARRWTNRQSALSAVSPATREVLIVIEALHEEAETSVVRLRDTLAAAIVETWGIAAPTGLSRAARDDFDIGAART